MKMKTESAIAYLNWLRFDSVFRYQIKHEAIVMAVEALEHQLEREKNEPLTIKELRQMHGEPVWIKEMGKWGIVAVDQSGMWKYIPFVHSRSFNLIVERNNFHCYRNKQEEEDHG